jgi:vanillate O-demethylase ferredoxin subunit
MTALAVKNAGPGTNKVLLEVRVHAIIPQGPDINCYEVIASAGGKLPAFEPGSHIDVSIPGGNLGVRQYSLCGDPQDRSRYRFAVQREKDGRGGSKAMFDSVNVGTHLIISPPRNNFPLRPDASRHLLLAGGIGITPMIAMLHYMMRERIDFTLHYCTRSAERTAFHDFLKPLVAAGKVAIHWDNGDPAKGLDLNKALQEYQSGTHLYYCGPPGFMGAVAAASAHWPAGTIHREFFTPSANDPGVAISQASEMESAEGELGPPFKVKIASTGEVYDIPSDKSLLNVLREHGLEIETQCELGVCGTCRTRYLEGEPDHRDFVLEEDEHKREMTVCCSRSKSRLLVLDL